MRTRMEADSIGTMEVPEEAYYGVQALRAKENFSITGAPMNPVFLENLARIKKAAAITNRDAFALDAGYAEAIIRACDEVIKGRFREEFIVDAIQGGAGTTEGIFRPFCPMLQTVQPVSADRMSTHRLSPS